MYTCFIVEGFCRVSRDCRDPNAVCIGGRCQCPQDYFPRNNRCGKCVDVEITWFSPLVFKICQQLQCHRTSLRLHGFSFRTGWCMHFFFGRTHSLYMYFHFAPNPKPCHLLNKYWFVSVPKIGNGDSCRFGDQCADIHAQCIGGVCRCMDTHYEKNGVCSEYP